MSLKDKIRQLPDSPGVYIMLDADGVIIYVGKARSLRQRVRSYFNSSGDSRYHVKFLVARITDIEVMLTDTEKEALLLENTLIKQHHPRYNLNLKDDKTYFSLRLDLREKFPRFTVVRRIPLDGARYFGPYSSSSSAREMLRLMTRMFPLRHYPLATCMARRRPCLYHQIGQCSAPCQGLISPEDYAALTDGAAMFLEGKGRQLVAEFKRRMAEEAAAMRYEEAARWRNLLRSIQITVEKQKVVLRGGDSDVAGFYRAENRIELAILFIRGGVLSGSRLFSLVWELDDAGGISAFIHQYYTSGAIIPEEILLPLEIEDSAALAELLREMRGGKVSITRPQRGTKRELVELACKNAESAIRERDESEAAAATILAELQQRLHLSRTPRRIECYDISTIQGSYPVGSGAVFINGAAEKKSYRRYRIKTVAAQDDFAMLKEVFSRRFSDAGIQKNGMPDLVVVDGGIGQLGAVHEIISELGLVGRFDLISLAKSRVAQDVSAESVMKSDERIFLPGRKNPVVLRQSSPALLMLAAIRNEAHRFAIEYHRKLRSSGGIVSEIDQIPGVGAKRRKNLLIQFGSLEKLRQATLEEILTVDDMNKNVAHRLYEWLRG